MTMADIYGVKRPFSRGTAVTILVIGWVCYFLAWCFNIIYYIIHPSAVKIRGLRSKMYFFFCGTKHNCCCHPDADNLSESNDNAINEHCIYTNSLFYYYSRDKL